jgi:threonine synthase
MFCSNCNYPYPSEGIVYCCPRCGGVFDYPGAIQFDPSKVDRSQPGIWRFRHTFELPLDLEPVSLGEGDTPLVWVKVFGRQVIFKCEYLNPSGSFKDRGSSVIVSWLMSRGVTEAIEDSSGNAGASFAAYAARAGMKARVFVPASASGPKRRQIEAYGADLVPVVGSRTDVANTARIAADSGAAYASHAYLPINLKGYATAAYEIVEQLGRMPGTIIVPAGQGGLLLGLKRGFDALLIGRAAQIPPRMIAVQARVCAPLCDFYVSGFASSSATTETHTLAEGVQVNNPLRKKEIITAVQTSHGQILAVDEDEILPARDELAHLGFYVEPTSAIVWVALAELAEELFDPIVVILTGSGLKYG